MPSVFDVLKNNPQQNFESPIMTQVAPVPANEDTTNCDCHKKEKMEMLHRKMEFILVILLLIIAIMAILKNFTK